MRARRPHEWQDCRLSAAEAATLANLRAGTHVVVAVRKARTPQGIVAAHAAGAEAMREACLQKVLCLMSRYRAHRTVARVNGERTMAAAWDASVDAASDIEDAIRAVILEPSP